MPAFLPVIDGLPECWYTLSELDRARFSWFMADLVCLQVARSSCSRQESITHVQGQHHRLLFSCIMHVSQTLHERTSALFDPMVASDAPELISSTILVPSCVCLEIPPTDGNSRGGLGCESINLSAYMTGKHH